MNMQKATIPNECRIVTFLAQARDLHYTALSLIFELSNTFKNNNSIHIRFTSGHGSPLIGIGTLVKLRASLLTQDLTYTDKLFFPPCSPSPLKQVVLEFNLHMGKVTLY